MEEPPRIDLELIDYSTSRRSTSPAAFGFYFLLAIIALAYAALHKGVGIDEAYSQFAASHDVPLAVLWRERWLNDVHPGGYYLLSWLLDPLTGSNVRLARLWNMLPLSLTALGLWSIAGEQHRKPAIVVMILLVGSALPFDYFISHRSYYWIVCSVAVAAFAMCAVLDRPAVTAKIVGPLAVASILALNLQFLCAFFFAIGAAVFLVQFWLTGNRRWAVVLAACLTAGCIAMLAQVWIQYPALDYYHRTFWATTTTSEALIALGSAAALTIASSGLMWVYLLVHRDGSRIAFMLCLGAVAAIWISGLLLNVWRPLLIRQYVSPLVSFLIVGAAFFGSKIMDRPRWLAALLIGEITTFTFYSAMRSRVQDQDEIAALVADAVAACPSSVVIGLSPRMAGQVEPIRNVTDAFYRSDYRHLADDHGFSLGNRPDAKCPLILWAEWFQPNLPVAEMARRAGLSLSTGQADRATTDDRHYGFVVSIPPRLP